MNRKYTLFIPFLIFLFFIWACSTHTTSKRIIESEPPSSPQELEDFSPAKETVLPVEEESREDFLIQDKTSIEDKDDPSSLLEQAIDTYQDAQNAWERGDFDTALSALDEAYGLILKVRLPADSPLNEEKNSLRLLIAQRIQEIYGSRLVAVGDNNRTIPLVENEHVLKEIKNFQTKEKEFFEEGYKRSGIFREMILEELKKVGLPEQLSWIPLIESWFKVRAYSRARALGLWQFISSTGYRFGLKRDRWVDERMDPIKSTQAAIKYLTELHSLFGDWTTVMAAYNCGEFRVQRVIRTQRVEYLDNFWDLYRMLPLETARFVPRFIAALLIINNPEKYDFNLPQPDPPQKYETILFNRPIKLSTLSTKLGLNANELASLNPELRHDATPNYEYSLKVPLGNGNKALMTIHSLPRWIPPEATYSWHYVRRGENLSGIARQYRTTVSAIARLNRLRRVHLIRPGQRLKIPGSRSSRVSRPAPVQLKNGEKITYTVKRGDSLYRIANAFGTTAQRIKQDNNLKSNIIKVGQKLLIQSGKPEGSVIYKVKAGDTPYEIAKKYGMNLQTLLRINGLSYRSKIHPGQELWVIPKK